MIFRAVHPILFTDFAFDLRLETVITLSVIVESFSESLSKSCRDLLKSVKDLMGKVVSEYSHIFGKRVAIDCYRQIGDNRQ